MATYGPYRLQRSFSVVTVAAEIRKKLDIKSGDWVVWVIDNEGRCILKKASIKVE